jgi:four helix bundle protein
VLASSFNKMPIHSHKDLIVWQKGIDLSKKIYILTEKFPREEIYGITSQMRRAAISIPSNIAEGRSRGTRKDFVQFLRIAIGSASELETQIEIAKNLPQTKNLSYQEVDILLDEVSRMIMGMIKKLSIKS